MSLFTKIGKLGKAGGSDFTPRANIPRSDVQAAVEYVMDNAENVGTVYADKDAEYLVKTSSSGLTNERVVTDTDTITWNFATTGQAKASLTHLGIESLTDPGADRVIGWDDSEGAVKFFTPAQGLSFVGSYLSITDANLSYIVNASFSPGDILYHDGTTLTRLAAGTSGHFLKTRGTSAAPIWEHLPAGEGLGDLLSTNNLSDLADFAAARSNLGLTIGSQVQGWSSNLDSWSALAPSTKQNADATLTALAGVTTSADQIIYATGSDAFTTTSLTAFGRTLIDDADAATARTTLGLVIGTNVQAYDAELTALAGLTSAADTVPYFTGSGTASLGTFTAFGRSLVDDADAATARATLGLVIGTNVQAYDAELAAVAGLSSSSNTVPRFTGSGTADLLTFDTDGTLAGNSDTRLASQKAVKTYVDQIIASQDAMVFKGVIDCSANPNYPAADRGHTYRVSVAGKIGGASGTNVEVGDLLLCITDGTSAGTQAGVGSNWSISQANLDGAVIGPSSATDSNFAQFDGTSGKLIKGGLSFDTDGTLSANSATRVPSQSAVKTYADTKQPLDSELTALAGVTSAADALPYFTGAGTAATTTLTSFARTLIDDTDAATMRTTLGLAIGTNVQAYDAELAALASVTSAADKVPYFTGSGTATVADFTSFGRSLVDDANASAARTTLGVAIGTDVQAYSANNTIRSLTYCIDGGGATITTGNKKGFRVPFACTINSVTLGADQSGSIVIDIWKRAHASYPPTVSQTITASAKPTLSSATNSEDSTLTGWTTSISAGDWLFFNVDSVTTCQFVTVSLKVTTT